MKALTMLLLAVLTVEVAGPHATQQVFRSDTRTVAVYATVQSRDGHLVPDLHREDFQIYDDGKPVDVTTFSNDMLPITAVLLLDMSNSMIKEFFRVRESALQFSQRLATGDRLRIGTFGREVALSPWLTDDTAILARVIEEEVWPGGATPLWRASKAAMDSLVREAGRRVILLLTDGNDSGGDFNCAPLVRDPNGRIGPCPDEAVVRRQADDEGFMFYAVGMEGGLDPGLKDIANRTGGGSVQLKRNADLDTAFARVADELHHQYVLGFTPVAADGRTHRIEIKLTKPGLTARARSSYVAVNR